MTTNPWIISAVVCGMAAAAAAQTTRPTTQPATTEPAARSLTAEQMLSKMLKAPPSAAKPLQPISDPAAVDRTSGAGAVAPNAPSVTVLREGTFLVDRVGRLTRGSDASQSEFTFEADGKAMKDPPVIILPNLKLTAMESANGIANRDLRFRISGMVTEYHGRNYVLLDKVVVVPDPAQQF